MVRIFKHNVQNYVIKEYIYYTLALYTVLIETVLRMTMCYKLVASWGTHGGHLENKCEITWKSMEILCGSLE